MKTIAKNWKYLKYLLWLGPFLILMGLTAGVVSGNWGAVPLALMIAGMVVISLWLIVQTSNNPPSSQTFWGRRATQVGTNAFTATLAVLVILGLINFMAARYPLRVDFTENQILSLAPESKQVVRNFDRPVKVWIFDQDPNAQDLELLENYRRQNSGFSFEYVDPDARPDLTEKFGVADLGEVYLEYGQKRNFVQLINNFDRLSEVRLTNALDLIKSDRRAKVYFLQGHGELSLEAGQASLAQAVQSLKDKNYTSEPLNLAERSQVPSDASVVVIAGPKQALFEGEVQALREYLKRGGNLLLMINPKTDPGLESLLKEWGVTLDNRLVINASDRQVRGFGPAAALVTEYGDHPITKGFGNRFSFYPFARPVEFTPVSDVNVTPLLRTSEQSWAESNPEKLEFNPESDRQGPIILGLALSRRVDTIADVKPAQPNATASPSPSPSPTASPTVEPTPNAASDKPKEARMVVLGNASFAADGLFSQQINGDVLINSISWLSQQDDRALSIRPKQSQNRRLTLTAQQDRTLAWLAVVIVPLIGFSTAGLLWWKRR